MSARDHKVDPGKDCICLIMIQESGYKENSGSISAVFLCLYGQKKSKGSGGKKKEKWKMFWGISCNKIMLY